MEKEASGEVEGVAPGENFRDFAGIRRADGEVQDAAGAGGGEKGHFGFELEMIAGWEPWAEPRAADEAETALTVDDAAAAEQGGHRAIGPAAEGGHVRGIGETVADDEVGVMAESPEAIKVAGVMLSVAVEEEEPVDGSGDTTKSMAEGGGFAVARAGKGENLGTGAGGKKVGGIGSVVVDDPHGETGEAASGDDLGDGGGFVAGGDEHQGAGLGAGGIVRARGGNCGPWAKQPRACRHD